MPGPPPKDPSQRRNRRHVAGQTTLVPLQPGEVVKPNLPPHPSGLGWHPYAVAEWDVFWLSPMARQIQAADLGTFVRYLSLVDLYWRMLTDSETLDIRGIGQLSGEIRRMGERFGLSPLDRWRLKWEVDRGEERETARARGRRRDPRLV